MIVEIYSVTKLSSATDPRKIFLKNNSHPTKNSVVRKISLAKNRGNFFKQNLEPGKTSTWKMSPRKTHWLQISVTKISRVETVLEKLASQTREKNILVKKLQPTKKVCRDKNQSGWINLKNYSWKKLIDYKTRPLK